MYKFVLKKACWVFSGLVREIGKVVGLRGNTLQIECAHKAQVGDSIAVNGTCLTAISVDSRGFSAELSDESKQCVALENFSAGNKVHIEPALRADSCLDGHIVQGHIDAIGKITHISHKGAQSEFILQLDSVPLRYILPKGSVCVDGISLTSGKKSASGFELVIIPHTLKNTLFGEYKIGRRVNIETDMFVRNAFSAVEYFLQTKDLTQGVDSVNLSKNLSWSQIDFMQMRF
ncbi:riboflavin synthase [Helicobacter himalayensis]|uniref:riboflavin synthase n=1 Tax=Helicobacter himalayensis TaxID=1591088 RepID=UPI000A6B02B4|nr:riboflavin synthase [Helicobacter himalayensis]